MENQVMASQEIVIVGAGGHGREVLDVLRAQDPDCETLKFAGFISDDKPDPQILAKIEANWLGTVDDFLANIKSDPGGLRFSHTGAGSIYFFGIHQLLKASGSGGDAAVAVPYKGGSKSMAELLRGEVDFHPTNLVSAVDFIKTGAVRAGGYNERAP